MLADWIGNAGDPGMEWMQMDDDPNHTATGCATLRIGVLSDERTYAGINENGLPLEEIEAGNQDVIDNIVYPDCFYDVGSEDLSNVFRKVLDMLTCNIFVPVSGKTAPARRTASHIMIRSVGICRSNTAPFGCRQRNKMTLLRPPSIRMWPISATIWRHSFSVGCMTCCAQQCTIPAPTAIIWNLSAKATGNSRRDAGTANTACRKICQMRADMAAGSIASVSRR